MEEKRSPLAARRFHGALEQLGIPYEKLFGAGKYLRHADKDWAELVMLSDMKNVRIKWQKLGMPVKDVNKVAQYLSKKAGREITAYHLSDDEFTDKAFYDLVKGKPDIKSVDLSEESIDAVASRVVEKQKRERPEEEIMLFDFADDTAEEKLVGELIKWGGKFYNDGEFKKTLALMDAALVMPVKNHSVWNNRGNALKKLGSHKEAITAFEEALKLKPGSAQVRFNLANVHKVLAVLHAEDREYQEKEYKEAEKNLNLAIILDHKDARFYVNRGNVYRETGRADKAIEDYKRAEVVEAILFNMGYALYDQGKLDEAEAYFHKALQLYPDDPSSYNELGRIAYDRGNYQKAVELFTKSLEFNSKFLMAWFNRGNTYRKLNRYGEAIVDYTHALELTPWDEQIYVNRGYTYEKRGELERAEEDYLKAWELNPDEAIILANLANLHFKKEEYDKALAEIENALVMIRSLKTKSKVPGRDITILFSFAAIQLCRGQIEKAVAMYLETIGSDKTTAAHLRGAAHELKIVIERFPELKEAEEILKEIERRLE